MSTGDRIVLTGVRARGHHGVLAHEKRDGQDFVVDVTMHLDLSAAARTDDLAATVSYAEVAADVVALVSGPSLDLIETLAARIAEEVLRRDLVDRVEVTVHKPQAPVGVPFGDVAVHVVRERATPVVIALGANLGDAEATLLRAVDLLAGEVTPTALAPLVRSEPVGGPDQPPYVNSVLLGTTRLGPAALLAALHRVEARLGRVREVRWGPRTIDLDLVQHGDPAAGTDTRSEDPGLLLPHPRAHERAFVLVPWARVDPAARLRVGDEVVAVADLLERVDRSGVTDLR